MYKNRKIEREFRDLIEKYEEFNVSLIDDENIFEWKVELPGPKDSPYEKGIFELEIKFPFNYPTYPPKVKFITKIYHPCINRSTGKTSFDFLFENWNNEFTIYDILLKIQNGLKNPDIKHYIWETDIANQYKICREKFEKTAREWTKKYAYEDDNLINSNNNKDNNTLKTNINFKNLNLNNPINNINPNINNNNNNNIFYNNNFNNLNNLMNQNNNFVPNNYINGHNVNDNNINKKNGNYIISFRGDIYNELFRQITISYMRINNNLYNNDNIQMNRNNNMPNNNNIRNNINFNNNYNNNYMENNNNNIIPNNRNIQNENNINLIPNNQNNPNFYNLGNNGLHINFGLQNNNNFNNQDNTIQIEKINNNNED